MHIEKPKIGEVTQGAIFTAASAENYPSKPTWGLCITARCDMAHENKVKVFNYLPIVRYEDWILNDGAKILTERINNELNGAAKNLLKSKNKSETILESYPIKIIAEKIFPEGGKFHEIANKLENINLKNNDYPMTIADIAEIAKYNEKCCEKILKELWSNQLSGYYYLSSIGNTEYSSTSGYVILLREVRHIPKIMAEKISCGIFLEEEDINILAQSNFNKAVFDFVSITGVLKSPWIEHLLQNFSIMFSRIGLPDPEKKLLKNLNGVILNV